MRIHPIEPMAAEPQVLALARKLEVDMPVSQHVYQVVHEGQSPQDAVRSLLSRQPRSES